jgi:uncharacterized phage protein (TIGR02220 family)
MSGNRKSFLLHIDSLDVLDDLTDEQAGQLFKIIKAYQRHEEINPEPFVKIAFSPFKNQFIRDDEKYVKTCEARAEAGALGGKAKASKSKQKVASANKSKQAVAKLADSVNKNDSDSEKDSGSDKHIELTSPATKIFAYFKECTGRSFRTSPELDARLNEGRTYEEITAVINYKAREWMNSDMQKYLRPQTLFNKNKFDGYLNDAQQRVSSNSVTKDSQPPTASTNDMAQLRASDIN